MLLLLFPGARGGRLHCQNDSLSLFINRGTQGDGRWTDVAKGARDSLPRRLAYLLSTNERRTSISKTKPTITFFGSNHPLRPKEDFPPKRVSRLSDYWSSLPEKPCVSLWGRWSSFVSGFFPI